MVGCLAIAIRYLTNLTNTLLGGTAAASLTGAAAAMGVGRRGEKEHEGAVTFGFNEFKVRRCQGLCYLVA